MKTAFKILIALTVIAAAAFGGHRYFTPENKIAYITEPVKRGTVRQTVSAVGELTASQLVDVGAQASGQITKIYVAIGSTVQQGDVIAEIDSTTQRNALANHRAKLDTHRAQLESAQIALKTAQRKFDRYRALQQADAVSREELENTEDALAAAKAKIKELHSAIKQTETAINTAEADLGYTRITAPISGTVVSLAAEAGQTVNANNSSPTIAQIADLSVMLNKMQIAEGDATKVKAGQKLSFTILSEPDAPIEGVLESMDPGLTALSKGSYSKNADGGDSAVYYYARALIDNPEGKLAIGMTTQNEIQIQSAEDVLVVPNMTVKTRQGKASVRVLGADGKAQEREVETGLKDTMNVEIRKGLKEGEQVVVSEMSADEQSEQVNKRPQRNGPPMR
ncbi:efflux RND transporter periplasmic adaptor subunit [Conchiformibius kuhniae]|uniref:Efflux RND transporter periplasmic adaptor subunit n=1 Tax=Conchiformibius kuhniae TaxID=211502 RepID=A0A8T9MXQ8_9NEIS|nr:efflux RND transporter periplasmic adaptor subunit [Conchiformibius kuhniae]UOP05665.1 efflux RND transporter periplasmic adaptor subunit [Conchiformibius kuhniae]